MAEPGAEQQYLRAGLGKDDVELYEINEAFAVVTAACTRLAGLSNDRVNVRGGAIALGHPIGASGARILVTLLCAMAERRAKRRHRDRVPRRGRGGRAAGRAAVARGLLPIGIRRFTTRRARKLRAGGVPPMPAAPA